MTATAVAPTAPLTPGTTSSPPDRRTAPELRGRLVIRPAAIRSIAERAAREVPGVVRLHRGVLTIGSDLPHADVALMGHQVRLEIATAVAWPTPLAAVAAAVRDRVGRQVRALTSYTVTAVDVTVDDVIAPRSPASTARRVE